MGCEIKGDLVHCGRIINAGELANILETVASCSRLSGLDGLTTLSTSTGQTVKREHIFIWLSAGNIGKKLKKGARKKSRRVADTSGFQVCHSPEGTFMSAAISGLDPVGPLKPAFWWKNR